MTAPARWLTFAGLLLALAVLALAVPKLALFVAVGTLVAYLILPALTPRSRRAAKLVFGLAGVVSTVAVIRFIALVAVPSLVAAGNDAQAFNAVTRLREVLLAQDFMRKRALVDPDGDSVGSAALVEELRGTIPLRGRTKLDPPLLNNTYSHIESTPIGPAALVSGYYLIICLPRVDGGYTAKSDDPIDEEAAERRFLAYAWPAAAKHGPQQAYFIDEHDRILVSENRSGTETRYAGSFFPPPCDAATAEATAGDWKPWRDKAPRRTLPGDTAQ